jgi:hypothetical protein
MLSSINNLFEIISKMLFSMLKKFDEYLAAYKLLKHRAKA